MRRPPSLLIVTTLFLMWCHSAWALLDTVQITNLSDINLPNWSTGDPAVSASADICVYVIKLLSNSDYAITASSPGGFFLNNGPQKIPYTLYWEDSGAGHLGSSGGTQLSNNVKLGSRQNANILSPLCALGLIGPNARLYLKITQADMAAALAGTYTGTVTLMISPN